MYFIGYDIGSSSIKASLVEKSTGKHIGTVTHPQSEMEISVPKSNWAEQDPELWWKYLCIATKDLLQSHQIDPNSIDGIGISYQMHGLVLLDRAGNLLRDAIIWCDSRAIEIGNAALKSIGVTKCGSHSLNSPGNFTASKLKWVQENEPELYKKIYKAMLPGDYIAYRFSQQIGTTISGLSEGVFWDFKEQQIASWLLKHYGIATDLLAELVPTFGFQGKVTAKASEESGLAEGTPILYRAGDQPNNAFSLNVLQPGEIAMTGGTSGVIYGLSDQLNSTEISRINSFAHVNYSKEHPVIGKLLCINGAGIQYRWLKNTLNIESYDSMNTMAKSVKIGSEGLLLYPFGNGAERMLEAQNKGSCFYNLDLNVHSNSHLCRAALEGIAFAFVYGMEIIMAEGIKPKVIRAGNDNLFQAEVFAKTICSLIGQPIEIYNTTGATGAARACAMYQSGSTANQNLLSNVDLVHTYSPEKDIIPYKKAYQNWKTNLVNTLK